MAQWQYQGKVEPLEQSLYTDSSQQLAWSPRPSEPVRTIPRAVENGRLTNILAPHLFAVPFPDKWWEPASEPQKNFSPIFRQFSQFTGLIEPTLYVVPNHIAWWRQPSEPIRDQMPRVRPLGETTFLDPQEVFKESIYPDKYWRQTSEPVRGTRLAEPWLARSDKNQNPLLSQNPDRWWTQANEPQRQMPRALQAQWFATSPEPSTVVIPNHVGWWNPASEQVRNHLPRVPGLGFSVVDLEPSIMTTTPVLAWFTQATEPVRNFLPRVPGIGYVEAHTEPTLYVVPNHIGWFQQASEPVKLPVARTVGLERMPFVGPLEPVQLNLGIFTDWYKPPASVDRVRALAPQGGHDGHVDAMTNAVPPLSWWTQASEPQLKPLPRVANGPYFVQPGEPIQDFGVGTLSQWFRQASEPVRTHLPRVPGLGFIIFQTNPGDVVVQLTVTGDIWYAIPPDTSEGAVWFAADRGTVWYAYRT